VALTTRPNVTKNLQTDFPRGTPFDHQESTTLGVSSALAHQLFEIGMAGAAGSGSFCVSQRHLASAGLLEVSVASDARFHVGGQTPWHGAVPPQCLGTCR